MSTETPNTMTDSNENDAVKASHAVNITAQDVLDYVSQNPTFFSDHADALPDMELSDVMESSHEQQGVTSLVQRQADVLRKDNALLNDKLITLIDTAKQNESLYKTTHDLVLQVLDNYSLPQMLELLNGGLSEYFDIQCSRLMLLDARFDSVQANVSQSIDDLDDSVQTLLNSKKMVCGSLRPHEYDCFFPDTPDLVSAVVYPLCYKDELIGVFAMGSSDCDHFMTGSDSTLIDFLSRVIEINLNRCLQTSD
ncbi:MAG: DUF484 family protein [Pseudomonadota bacterium]